MEWIWGKLHTTIINLGWTFSKPGRNVDDQVAAADFFILQSWYFARVSAGHLDAWSQDEQSSVSLVRVSGHCIVQVQLVSHRSQTLGWRGGNPLIEWQSVGIEIPLQHQRLLFSRIQGIGTVKNDVTQWTILNHRRIKLEWTQLYRKCPWKHVNRIMLQWNIEFFYL